MKINLDDRLVEELDSLFENERKTQTEWDVCIEDIVEEYIAEEEEESDTIYIDLRNATNSNGVNGKYNHTVTQPPFEKRHTLQNRFKRK